MFMYEGGDIAAGSEGTCYCGAVKVKCEGPPVKKIMCSCRSCQHWTGGFANAGCLYPQEKVTVEGDIKSFCRDPKHPMPSHRKFCAKCGGHVMNSHPSAGMDDVCAGILKAFPFKPDVFINYGDPTRPFHY